MEEKYLSHQAYLFRSKNVSGLEICGGATPYLYIVAAIYGDHTLFMIELCIIFGITVLQYNTSSEHIKYMRLKSLKEKEVSKHHFKAIKKYCEKQLLDILKSLQKFYWVSLCD